MFIGRWSWGCCESFSSSSFRTREWVWLNCLAYLGFSNWTHHSRVVVLVILHNPVNDTRAPQTTSRLHISWAQCVLACFHLCESSELSRCFSTSKKHGVNVWYPILKHVQFGDKWVCCDIVQTRLNRFILRTSAPHRNQTSFDPDYKPKLWNNMM